MHIIKENDSCSFFANDTTTIYNNVGAQLLESSGNSSDGTTGSGTSNEHVDLSIAGSVDLLGSVVVVSDGVVGVGVLVEDNRVGDLGVQALGNSNVGLGGIPGSLGGGADNLSTKGLEDVNLLLGHLLGQSNDGAVTLDSGSQSKTDT